MTEGYETAYYKINNNFMAMWPVACSNLLLFPNFIFETWFGCTIVNSETILCPHLHRPVFNITLKKKLLRYILFNSLRLRISFFKEAKAKIDSSKYKTQLQNCTIRTQAIYYYIISFLLLVICMHPGLEGNKILIPCMCFTCT